MHLLNHCPVLKNGSSWKFGHFFPYGYFNDGSSRFFDRRKRTELCATDGLETLRHALRLPSHKPMLEPAHEQLELGDRIHFLPYFPTDTCINKDICLDHSLYYPQVPMIMMQQGELDKPI